MDSHNETVPVAPSAASTSTWKQRLFTICYFIVCAVATLGWLAALGWAAITLASELFF
jgi:hypothetical protein